jgi:hypothetical protein
MKTDADDGEKLRHQFTICFHPVAVGEIMRKTGPMALAALLFLLVFVE